MSLALLSQNCLFLMHQSLKRLLTQHHLPLNLKSSKMTKAFKVLLGIAAATSLSACVSLPKVPELPEVPDLPELPEVPSVELPETPAVPKVDTSSIPFSPM